jgi:hypothetical protein
MFDCTNLAQMFLPVNYDFAAAIPVLNQIDCGFSRLRQIETDALQKIRFNPPYPVCSAVDFAQIGVSRPLPIA